MDTAASGSPVQNEPPTLDPELMEIDTSILLGLPILSTGPSNETAVAIDLPVPIDPPSSISKTILPLFTKKEISQIQSDIQHTTRPSWQASLPVNFGNASHGKLKADQWRTCIEFDLPISLARIWTERDSDDSDVLTLQLLDNTMHLATAVLWATSRRTSRIHAENYTKHITAYIRGVLHLFPQHPLRPHHHNALHLGELLLQFGPAHGWWTFPFERLVGKLQEINSNSKPGKTILIKQ
jgi:hypothetical protein